MAMKGQFLLCSLAAILACYLAKVSGPVKPTPDILAWSKREIGAFFSFNMVTMLPPSNDTNYLCRGVSGGSDWLPPPDLFNPDKLDIGQWVQAAVSMGAKYAVLTAQHCGGFSMWPTDVYNETGFNYTYSRRSV